jgi:hypothetical protein
VSVSLTNVCSDFDFSFLDGVASTQLNDVLDKAKRRAHERGVDALERCTAQVVAVGILHRQNKLVELEEALLDTSRLSPHVAHVVRRQLKLVPASDDNAHAPVAVSCPFSVADVCTLMAPYVRMVLHKLVESADLYWRVFADADADADRLRHCALIGSLAAAVKAGAAPKVQRCLVAFQSQKGSMSKELCAAFATVHAKHVLKCSSNDLKKIEQAIKLLESAAANRPDNIGTLIQLSKANVRRAAKLKELASKSKTACSKTTLCGQRAAALEAALKNYDAAQALFQGPVHGEVLLQRGQILLDLRRFGEAHECYATLMKQAEQIYDGRLAFYKYKCASFLFYGGMMSRWVSWPRCAAMEQALQGLDALRDDRATELKLYALLVRLYNPQVRDVKDGRNVFTFEDAAAIDARCVEYAWRYVRTSVGSAAKERLANDAVLCFDLLEHCFSRCISDRTLRIDAHDGSAVDDAWAPELALCELHIVGGALRFDETKRLLEVKQAVASLLARALQQQQFDGQRFALCDVARQLTMAKDVGLEPRDLIESMPTFARGRLRPLVEARLKLLDAVGEGGALFRAEYDTSRAAFAQRGIVAKDATETRHTAAEHVHNGDLATRFVSFTTTLAVATTYWMFAYRRTLRENRMLLRLNALHPTFRVFEVRTRADFPQGRAQGCATLDREVIIHGSFPASCVSCEYDAAAAYAADSRFKAAVDGTPANKNAQFVKAAMALHDFPLNDVLRAHEKKLHL